jgi:hypothetical protein
VRKNCTPGSVRGRSGNWPSYRDALIFSRCEAPCQISQFQSPSQQPKFRPEANLLSIPSRLHRVWPAEKSVNWVTSLVSQTLA